MNYLDLITSLIDQLSQLSEQEEAKAKALLLRTAMLINNIFAEKSDSKRRYLAHLDKITFKTISFPVSLALQQKTWRSAYENQ